MRRTTVTALAVVALLSVAGCSSDDTEGSAPPSTEGGGTGSPGTAAEASPGGEDTTSTSTGSADCPDESTMAFVNTETSDGDVDVTWALTDDGPGVLNGDDQGLSVGLSSFEFPEDPQFGIEIPIDNADLPEGDVYLSVQIQNPDETLAAGQRFIDQTIYDAGEDPTADGKVLFVAAWDGTERIGPLADVEVTITEITTEHICGTISTPETETDLQSLAGVDATFVADRIEYLDGDIPED